MDDLGFEIFFSKMSRLAQGPTQPPFTSYLKRFPLRVSQLGNKDDYSLQSSAKVKNKWNLPPLHTHAFMACKGTTFTLCLLKLHCKAIKVLVLLSFTKTQ